MGINKNASNFLKQIDYSNESPFKNLPVFNFTQFNTELIQSLNDAEALCIFVYISTQPSDRHIDVDHICDRFDLKRKLVYKKVNYLAQRGLATLGERDVIIPNISK